MIVHFSREGPVIVDGVKTFLQITCGRGWGESKDDNDEEQLSIS